MRAQIALGLFGVSLLATSSSSSNESGRCPIAAEESSAVDEPYPAHALSPNDSLKSFDVVFHAQVVVPNRTCRLGWCAGLRVLRKVKGDPGDGHVLIRSMTADVKNTCGPSVFSRKGGKWLVFANRGTTPGGLAYLAADDDGPNFRTRVVPDFPTLEASHRQLRARLDHAINERLGRTRAVQ